MIMAAIRAQVVRDLTLLWRKRGDALQPVTEIIVARTDHIQKLVQIAGL